MRCRSNWRSSDRRERLPSDWLRIRRAVKARANGRCEAAEHAPGCDGVGTDCDHIIAGDDHDMGNLQWLSHACHKRKTERENAERNAVKTNARRHPAERSPGLLE